MLAFTANKIIIIKAIRRSERVLVNHCKHKKIGKTVNVDEENEFVLDCKLT